MKSAKRNVIISAVMAIALSVSLMAGATFALFTSESKTNISVTSGKVKVEATIDNFKAQSPEKINADGTVTTYTDGFVNGGTADLADNVITLKNITPGDKVSFNITVKNFSNVKTQYRTVLNATDNGLYNGLVFTIDGTVVSGASEWKALLASTDTTNGEVVATYECVIEMPISLDNKAQNEYQGKECSVAYTVEAVQGNYDTTYGKGITESGFAAATQNGTAEYYNGLGTKLTKINGVNAEAVAAYVNKNGEVKYVADLRTALIDGATEIYCKKNANMKINVNGGTNRSDDIMQSVTVYANGANFNNGEIAVGSLDNGEGRNASFTLAVYDANNVKVWGKTPNAGAVQNIILENCKNEGDTRYNDTGIMMYIVGDTDGYVNAYVNNCVIKNNSSGVYMSANGTLTVTNTTFENCATGIKASFKGKGTRTDRIENCTFKACGCLKDAAIAAGKDETNYSWLWNDSSAYKFKNDKGTMNVTLKNNTITDLIGDKEMVVSGDVTINKVKANIVSGNVDFGSKDGLQLEYNSDSVEVTLQKDATLNIVNDAMNNKTQLKTATFKGELENGEPTATVDVITKSVTAEGGQLNYQRGSTFIFENLNIKAGEGSFDGIVCDELVYKNCVIEGKLTLYGKATFINCTFKNEMKDQYSIWTWGGTDVTFEGCTFNTDCGKAILLYGQATAAKPTNLTVNNCAFNDRKEGAAGKAAIEIGNDYNATYNLVVNKATVNGFATGKNTDSKLWANKNSMDAAHLSVTIDGTKVL